MLHKEGNAQGTAKSSAGIVNVAENVPISVSELPKKENVFLSVKNTEVNRTHNKSSKDLT